MHLWRRIRAVAGKKPVIVMPHVWQHTSFEVFWDLDIVKHLE